MTATSIDRPRMWISPLLLNHHILIVGHPELEHTSVLKLTFQHWKSDESGMGICLNASPRSDSSDFPSYNFENKFLLYEKKDKKWVLYNPSVLCSILPFVPQFCLYQIGFNPQDDERNSWNFSKSVEDRSPRACRPSNNA